MKSQNEEQKLATPQTKTKKPRFSIEKLEERIAPSHTCRYGHNSRSTHGHCDGGVPPGWYKNGRS